MPVKTSGLRLLVICALCFVANLRAQNLVLGDLQSWDELDVSARVNKTVDFAWVSQGRFSIQYPNPQAFLTGGDLKIGLGHYFEVTPSYYYLGLQSVTGRGGHYQIPMLSATTRVTWKGFTVADRNRFLGALRSDKNFWIYVNRPRVDKSFGPARWGTSAFVWDEIFYFSLFRGWTRNRFAAGVHKQFTENWATDFYYLRQDDNQVQPRAIDGLSVTLELRIR